jgi:hypothetical protein
MSEEELAGLAEDIASRGELLEPIVLYEGAVLDGRNRLEACRRAKVEPRFITWEGPGSPLEWVIAKNLRRRHFTPSQRAVLALQVLPLLEKEARERMAAGVSPVRTVAQSCATVLLGGSMTYGRASEQAARLVGASSRYVQAARRVQKEWPVILPEVAAGKISLHDAEFAANLDEGTQMDILERVRESPPGKPMNFRRMIREGRDFQLGWAGAHRFVIRLWDEKLEELDAGEEISVHLGSRTCLVRLASDDS